MPVPHRLSAKDKVALTAVCSVCGEGAKIARNGRYGFVCVIGRREAQRRWMKAHPDKKRANKRRPPSEHRLSKRDGSPDTCKVCGPVTPVVVGRGYGCPNRAKERGFTSFPTEPQPACLICRTYLDRFGACAKCDNETDVDDLYVPLESRRHWSKQVDLLTREYLAADGYSVQPEEAWLSDDTESAVPGWKTLGSAEPFKGVRPEYAKLYGSGKR